MTSKKDLEERLEAIDAEIAELSSSSSGFKLSAEIERLRAALFSRDLHPPRGITEQFSSDHERAEQIRTLQREREEVLEELAAHNLSSEHGDTSSQPIRDQ